MFTIHKALASEKSKNEENTLLFYSFSQKVVTETLKEQREKVEIFALDFFFSGEYTNVQNRSEYDYEMFL